MRTIFATIITLATIASASAQSLTPKQLESNAKAVAKAEQAVTMAACKLEWLRTHAGQPKTTVAYYSFFVECLTRTASK